MNVKDAVCTRRSVRAYTDREVEPGRIAQLLEIAARAPSGGNVQPWNIHVLTADSLHRFKEAMAIRIAELPKGEGSEYDIYPASLPDVARTRIGEVGEAMYGHLGVARDDRVGRRAWFARNFRFFDAPVGLFCFVDRGAGQAQWSDLGMFLQTFMLLLREQGLDSCPQECWALYPRTVASLLDAPAEQMLFAGMAIGYKDDSHPVNRLITSRAPLESFVRFHN